MVADLLWDNQPGYFSFWGGSINQLENGNVGRGIRHKQSDAGANPLCSFGSAGSHADWHARKLSGNLVWFRQATKPIGPTAFPAFIQASLGSTD
jgi:hypothetical protein